MTVNKYLAEHGLAYEGKYNTFNGNLELRPHANAETIK